MFRLLTRTQFWFFRKGSGISFSTTLCILFSKKSISYVTFYKVAKFHRLAVFTSWGTVVGIVCQIVTSEILKLSSAFLSSLFLHTQKSQDKNLIILRTKRAFKWNKKAFLKSFHLPEILRPGSGPSMSQLQKTWFLLLNHNWIIISEQ